MHHLDSWVKRDQLDATCFIITLFSAQHVSGVNTSILSSLRLIRWVTPWVVSGPICVGVTLQCGYGGVVSVCRLKPAYACPLNSTWSATSPGRFIPGLRAPSTLWTGWVGHRAYLHAMEKKIRCNCGQAKCGHFSTRETHTRPAGILSGEFWVLWRPWPDQSRGNTEWQDNRHPMK